MDENVAESCGARLVNFLKNRTVVKKGIFCFKATRIQRKFGDFTKNLIRHFSFYSAKTNSVGFSNVKHVLSSGSGFEWKLVPKLVLQLTSQGS